MPGIVGIISDKPSDYLHSDLNKMLSCMLHEDFYNFGIFTENILNIITGWVNFENSFSDCMPVFNKNKDIILIYNGENFSDKLTPNNFDFKIDDKTFTTAHYLTDLYVKYGLNFVEKLNGCFSGILIDLKNRLVHIFNDRYGLNRIYYHQNKSEFLFSSEAKSILAVRDHLKSLNIDSLGEYCQFGCVLNYNTLFNGIGIIPPGSIWTWHHNEKFLEKQFYFKPQQWEQQSELDEETFLSKLTDTFERILPRYFKSRQKVGISMTGGLDTRAILSHIDYDSDNFPCYTFGGIYRDCYDVKIAQKISKLIGMPYSVLSLDSNFFTDFSTLAEKTIYITDGCHNLCGTHDLYLNKLAREIAPIRLTGKFGSEVLRGASTFKELNLDKKLFSNDFIKYIDRAKSKHGAMLKNEGLAFTCFQDIPNHEHGRLSVEQSQVSYRTPYMDNELIQLLFRRPKLLKDNKAISLHLINDLDPNLLEVPTDMGFGRNNNFISKMVRFNRLLSFKAEWYFNEGMPHWLSFFSSRCFTKLEDYFLGKHKIEHYRKWFKENLSTYIKSILLDDSTMHRPFFNKIFIEKMVTQHISGKKNYVKEINNALTVELICRQLIE